jgi:acyl dehydratase
MWDQTIRSAIYVNSFQRQSGTPLRHFLVNHTECAKILFRWTKSFRLRRKIHGSNLGLIPGTWCKEVAVAAERKRWAYEDFQPGMVLELGSLPVTAEEIVGFAAQFDPQPMHLEAEAGEASVLGGLSASGFHICAMAMRLMCDGFILDSTSEGAPGVDYVRWRKPVLAGDTIRLRVTVGSKRESRSRPDIGFVGVRHEVINQRGETVCELRNTGIFRKRSGKE